jgi:hypothetical protein
MAYHCFLVISVGMASIATFFRPAPALRQIAQDADRLRIRRDQLRDALTFLPPGNA